jgi:hypothetical protein
MSPQSRLVAGIVLIVVPTVEIGGASILSLLSPEATQPNAMIYLAYVAGVVLAVGLLVLAVGLIRGRRTQREPA